MAKKKKAATVKTVKAKLKPRPVLAYRVTFRDGTQRVVECEEFSGYGFTLEFTRHTPPDVYVTTLAIPYDLVTEVALVEPVAPELVPS